MSFIYLRLGGVSAVAKDFPLCGADLTYDPVLLSALGGEVLLTLFCLSGTPGYWLCDYPLQDEL